MLTIKNEYIENIPLLLVEEEDSIREKPIFFFLHGITSAKEHNLHIAYTIAQKGFRVILPDALHHGERETTDSERMRYRLFWKIILQSIEELPLLIEGLAKKGLASKENIAIGGTSMGAITTFGALATYKWIKSAVAFMGAPQYDQFAKQMFKVADESGMDIKEGEKEAILAKIEPYDLSSHLELLNNRPLFIWHGKEDKTVPFAYSLAFTKQLQESSTFNSNHLTFYAEDGVDHKISRKAMLEAGTWISEVMIENKHAIY